MSLDLTAPFLDGDRVRHIASGKFGLVKECYIAGMTLGVWTCRVQFDAERLLSAVAAEQIEIVRRRSGITLVVDNTITPARIACLGPAMEHPLHRRAGLPAPAPVAVPPSAAPGQASFQEPA